MEVTAGNPLALCELARTLTAAQLTGAEPLPSPLPLGADIADAFGRRSRRCRRGPSGRWSSSRRRTARRPARSIVR